MGEAVMEEPWYEKGAKLNRDRSDVILDAAVLGKAAAEKRLASVCGERDALKEECDELKARIATLEAGGRVERRVVYEIGIRNSVIGMRNSVDSEMGWYPAWDQADHCDNVEQWLASIHGKGLAGNIRNARMESRTVTVIETPWVEEKTPAK
jgi:hypothetical protein